ncbi:MAG: hypothetical protein Q8S84_03490 [bacterium]|nr:hypothetical protein [bacterium]MDP3380587.1 hypothetical protein [bacterium]
MYPLGQREYPQGEGLETKYKIILNLMAFPFRGKLALSLAVVPAVGRGRIKVQKVKIAS